jgi:hypothetical protein
MATAMANTLNACKNDTPDTSCDPEIFLGYPSGQTDDDEGDGAGEADSSGTTDDGVGCAPSAVDVEWVDL